MRPLPSVHKLIAAQPMPPAAEQSLPQQAMQPLTLASLAGTVRRRRATVLWSGAVGLTLALLYLVLTPPTYRASVRLLIENQTPRINSIQTVSSETVGQELAVLSQVEVLRSPRLAERVIQATSQSPSVQPAGAAQGGTAKPGEATAGKTSAPAPMLPANVIDQFLSRLSVSRVGPTSLIQVDFNDTSADRATQIVNTLARVYLDAQVEAKNTATKRASEWLTIRVAELREQIRTSEGRIERFKTDNNLFKIGQMTVDERVLSGTTEQLSAARAAEAAAMSRLEQMERLRNDPGQLLSLGRALQSDTIREYRRQAAEVARKRASVISRFGHQHPDVANADAELKDLEKQIALEAGRIVDSARNDYDLAKLQVKELEAKLVQLKGRIHENNQQAIELIEMERQHQSSSALYASLLARQQELESLETLNGPDARIVSYAVKPTKPAHPRKSIVLALSLISSLLVGLGLAFLLEALRPTFVAPEDVERQLGIPCLAAVPRLACAVEEPTQLSGLSRLLKPLGLQALAPALAGAMLPARRVLARITGTSDAATEARSAGQLLRPIAEPSTNAFTEAIFSLHNAVSATMAPGNGWVVAVTSAAALNGKSTIALAVADYCASSGKRTVLLDADLRSARLTQALAADAERSFLDIIDGDAAVADVVTADPESGLDICPAPRELGKRRPMDLLASKGMADIVANLRARYDLVVIDTSPFGRTVDPRPLFKLADSILVVVEHGASAVEEVRSDIRNSGLPMAKVLGAVLNKRP